VGRRQALEGADSGALAVQAWSMGYLDL
jgi:hypothetical protein